MAVIIQIRGDTAENWTAINPVLAEREFAYEMDTQRMKVGNGTTVWNSLVYLETIRQLERIPVVVTGGVLTLDMANAHERKFEVTAAQSGAFSIAFTGITQARFISLTIPITGSVPVTFPSNVVSRRLDARWNNTTRVISLVATGAGDLFELSFNVLPGPKYILRASDANYSS